MGSSGAPHDAWRRLRRESPIHWFDLPGGVGFWAVTKRADIVWISKQPSRFLNAPRLAIFEEGAPVEGERTLARHLLNMDPPEHGHFCKAASGWFTPRAIRRRQEEVQRADWRRVGRLWAWIAAGEPGPMPRADFPAPPPGPGTVHPC